MLSNTHAEESLLATAIAAPKLWHEISYITPEDFTQEHLAKLWHYVSELYDQGRAANPMTVSSQYLLAEQKDVKEYLMNLVITLITSINGVEYAKVVRDLSDRRKIKAAMQKVNEMLEDGALTAGEISSLGVAELSSEALSSVDFVNAYDLGGQVLEDLSKDVKVYSTGFPRMDKALAGGFYQNRLYAIGARMKSGKSLMKATLAYNMTKQRSARVLYISLEMGVCETYQRLLAMEMGINSLKFIDKDTRNTPWFLKKVAEANKNFKDRGLYFRSRPRMDVNELKTTIAKAAMSGLVDGIVVDYLQLVEGKGKSMSTAEHYDNVAQTLAEATKRYPVWILTSAQLNQDGNIRGSEGLLNACDLTFNMHKIEGEVMGNGYKEMDTAWLEMKVARYTQYMDVGAIGCPAYEIDINQGPMFVER